MDRFKRFFRKVESEPSPQPESTTEGKKRDADRIAAMVHQGLLERQFDVLGALASVDERVLHQLVEVTRAGEGMSSLFAATALSKAGEPAVAPLIEALEDEQVIVRQGSAMALGEIGNQRALQDLVARLVDESHLVRQAAAIALGKLGSPEALDPLLRAIGDENEIVRRAVVNALGMIGDERVLPALERVAAQDVEAVAERAREVMQEIQEHGAA
jgi:HEAT repeat protein